MLTSIKRLKIADVSSSLTIVLQVEGVVMDMEDTLR